LLGFMRGIFARGVECEELCEEFWLGYGDSTVCIVCEVESEEAGGLAIQGYFVVLADVGDDSVDVGLRVAEDKGVVDVNDDVRCLSGGDAIKQAVVEG